MSISDDHSPRPSRSGLGRRVKRVVFGLFGIVSALALVVGCATLFGGLRLRHPEPLEGAFVYPFSRVCYGPCPQEVREVIFIGGSLTFLGLCGIIAAYRLLAAGRGNGGAGEMEERDG